MKLHRGKARAARNRVLSLSVIGPIFLPVKGAVKNQFFKVCPTGYDLGLKVSQGGRGLTGYKFDSDSCIGYLDKLMHCNSLY